jgi:putative ABC transport system permease protein
MNDFRFAHRQLLRNPGFTAVVVVTLALGIGANTAVFSLINRVLLLPLPFKDPDRLVWVRAQDPRNNLLDNSASGPDYLAWRRDSTTFEELGAMEILREFNLRGLGEPVALKGAIATANFFSTFGFHFTLGNGFVEDHDRPGHERVVVFSHRFWLRHFGGDTNVLGKTLTIDDTPHLVIGVLAPGLSFLEDMVEAYMPITTAQLAGWYRHNLQVFGRLKPGVTLPRARAELSTISQRLAQESGNPGSKDAAIYFLHERLVEAARPAFLIVHAAVAMVLLIACANVANLLLARAQGRRREMAIRAALGGSRAQIIRQLLTESLLLSLAGASLGVLLASWGLELLPALSPRIRGMSIPFFAEISVDRHVLVFTLLVALAAALGSGLFPALQASKLSLTEGLQDGARGTTSPRHHRLLGALVIGQTALSVVLLVGTVLMIRNFIRLTKVDPGFEPRKLLSMRISLPASRYADQTAQRRFYAEVLRRVEALGPVESAAVVNMLPLDTDNVMNTFHIVGGPPLPAGSYRVAEWRVVSAGYFQTMRIPLREGRWFTEQDQGRLPVVIINEAFTRQYFGAEDPLRRQLITMGAPEPCQIVGIVGNEKFNGLGAPSPPILYLPLTQCGQASMSLVVRTRTDPLSLAKPVQKAIWGIDTAQPVSKVRCLEELTADSISIQRFVAMVLTVFAGVAVLLSSIGLYGVLAYAVSQRTHEIGVRLALGAERRQILRLVRVRGWKLAGCGLAIGLAGALALTFLVQSLLYEMSAQDPVTFLAAIAVLALTVSAACYFPARRAARVDPLVALRCE